MAGHGLASSRFDLIATRHVLFDPLFAGAALLRRLGLSIQLAYLLWLAPAALVLFGGFRAYARRVLPDARSDRLTAIFLALFFATPVLPALDWSSSIAPATRRDFLLQAIDATPALQLWGYFPIALSLGAFAYAMLWIERAVEGPDRRPNAIRASGAALLIAWLHPWQGATLIIVVLALAAIAGRPLRRLAPLALVAAAAALPIAYYALLPHIDGAWAIARDQNSLGGTEWRFVLGTLGPLGALAVGRPRLAGLSLQGRILVLWPLSALLLYWAAPPYPLHALETASLPLAVIAMRGWGFLPARRALLGAAALLLTVPGIVYAAQRLDQSARERPAAYVLARDDARALSYLDRAPTGGGVLAPVPQALIVPALTGRETWIGHPSWTTAYDLRSVEAAQLFAGALPVAVARRRVRRIGARFVFAPCGSSSRLAVALEPVSATARRFGCATVWALRPGSPPGPPRASGP